VETTASVSIERHYADVTFNVDRYTYTGVMENEVVAEQEEINPDEYIAVCNLLYPRILEKKVDKDECQLWAKQITLLEYSSILGVEAALEALLFPFLQQQATAKNPNFSLFKAIPLAQTYYIAVAKSSKQIFIFFSMFELVFCLCLLAVSKLKEVPETSASVDFNLSNMLYGTDDDTGGRLSTPLLWYKPRKFVKSLFGVRLQVQEEPV